MQAMHRVEDDECVSSRTQYLSLEKFSLSLQFIYFFLLKLAPSHNAIFKNTWTITYLTDYCGKSLPRWQFIQVTLVR